MKRLYAVILATCMVSFILVQPVKAQYSQKRSVMSLHELIGVTDITDIVSYHNGSPDSLTNHLKDSIMVHIRGPKGMLFDGLQSKMPSTPARTFSVLKGSQTASINMDKLRQGTGPNKKTELILTIPGVRVNQGGWNMLPVQWTLGTTDHQPTFTQIKYMGGAKGYQIVFVYEEGLPKSEQMDNDDDMSLMYHIDAHICLPNDPKCL